MIQAIDLRKVFNMNRPNEFVALDGINVRIPAGGITVLKGPSGSGKTTLLSIIGCMARPTSGRLMLRGREITSLPERFLAEIRRKHFGFIFQQFNMIRGISAMENIMVPAYPAGEKRSRLRDRARGLLRFFGLENKGSLPVEFLSGGELQRVAIARALVNDPMAVIADEPTAHLDTKMSGEFMDAMMKLKNEGRSVMIASHDPIVYGSEYVNTVIEMRDGAILGARAIS